MAYAVGHVSGGHFNPAVTLGLAASGRFSWRDVLPYVVTQVAAAIAAAAVLWAIASGTDSFAGQDGGFASNGYGDRSPGGYNLASAALIRGRADGLLPAGDPRLDRHPGTEGLRPIAIGLPSP